MALTLRTVNSVQKAGPRKVVWDGQISGLRLRVSPNGERVYVLKYRTRDSRQRWFTIGRHGSPWTPEMARREAQRLLGAIADGKDPVAEKHSARGAITIAAFSQRYMDDHATAKKKPSSIRMDRINLDKHVLPSLGRRTLEDLSRADIAKFHSKLKATPGAANRCLALLSKMMNLAEAWGLRADGSNPCRHIEKYPEKSRERFLSAVELGRLGEACAKREKEGYPYFVALVRLLIFTGARLSEIQKAKWEWVDLEAGVLRLPDSKTGSKTVILAAPAVTLLEALPRIEGNPHVIAGPDSGYLDAHRSQIGECPNARSTSFICEFWSF
ncbi:MAG: integrase arm-type DNA-binding domain-containing protein [Afipia sp.]|nr:integrase arm-type DNA-binding domain-containing protein [Afipia sp.]